MLCQCHCISTFIYIGEKERASFSGQLNDCVIVIMLFIGGDINTVSGKLVSCIIVSVIVSKFTYIGEKERASVSGQ